MIDEGLQTEFDAALISNARMVHATAASTAELRELGPDILARSVFSARAVSAIYAAKIKEVISQLTAGDIGEGQARTALYICLDELGYTPEGGFPGHEGEVPPAVQGSLEDLRSFRRMDLLVRTQLDLMTGAGQQKRGHDALSLSLFPAWELVRTEARTAPRDWEARWAISGGKPGTRMMALKGDPVWGELGSYDNFQDALGVDHPPFAFGSGMGWREVEAADCEGLTGPNGETADEWFASQPRTLAGGLPLPEPQISLADVDEEIISQFQRDTHATPVVGKPGVLDFSKILADELRKTHGGGR
jgi:hypothetical protein